MEYHTPHAVDRQLHVGPVPLRDERLGEVAVLAALAAVLVDVREVACRGVGMECRSNREQSDSATGNDGKY